MAEGVQVGSSVLTLTAYQSELSSQEHLSRGVGLQEDVRANQKSAYCKELLMRRGTEFSFEELRAERFNQQKQQQVQEKLQQLTKVKEQLSLELQEKKKLLLLRSQEVPEGPSSQSRDSGPADPCFQIYDGSAAARPAGNDEKSANKLLDNVFLRPDERGLCLKVQYPRPDLHRGTAEDHQTPVELRPPSVCEKPASKTRKQLSPIQETNVETSSVTPLRGLAAGNCSLLQEDQDQEGTDQAPAPAGGAVDPCHPDVRQQLLNLCDVTSSPDFHSEPRPLPAVEEHSCLQLGGEVFLIFSRVVDGGSFSVYKGSTEDQYVVMKVDSLSLPWDFHQFQRLKKNWPTVDSRPLISCFLFLDGCITIYTSPTDYMFTELTECVPSELSVGYKAIGLLQLVLQLHSCRLLHAGLQPPILTSCHRGFPSPDWVFPVDWSSSVDLDLQRDITSVQQVLSAQTYISLGVLEPTSPPQLVDLVGVAETVHLLLTRSRMIAVKDDGGWTAEHFSGDEPCDMFTRTWRRFFRSLLNAGGRSSLCVLSDLKEQLSALYR